MFSPATTTARTRPRRRPARQTRATGSAAASWRTGTPSPPVRSRAAEVGAVAPQQHDGADLADELHHDARDQQGVDHGAQRQCAARDRDHAQHQQRDVGELSRGVESGERLEEISLPRRGVRDARVAEQQREYRSERRPQDEEREPGRDPGPVDALHEDRDDESRRRLLLGRDELAPGHHPDHREIDREINRGDGDRADQDRAGDDPARIAHLVADVADIVIAEVVADT